MKLALIETLMATLLICLPWGDGTNKRFVVCLPAGIDLEEVVSTPQLKSTTVTASKRVTVRETLSRLRARCKKGKLIDGAGREIRFYRLVGCWGNPPDNYQEQLARQNQELQRLKKKYTVVEISCAQIDPRQIQ
jgi:hypothetical protein